MDVVESDAYQGLEREIKAAESLKSNLLIVTLPGMGITRMMKELAAHNKWNLINQFDYKIEDFNLVNWDWKNSEEAERELQKLLAKLSPTQKAAVAVNYPKAINNGGSWWNHFYRQYIFGARNKEDSWRLMDEIKKGIAEVEKNQIWKKSAGMAQIIKYLAINGVEDSSGIEPIIKPIIEAMAGVEASMLKQLIGNFEGSLIEEYQIKLGEESGVDIKIDFDLNFWEKGRAGSEVFTKNEAEIVRKMQLNKGVISKEEVSDIKWGEGKYDEYSDQAINKTMRRLDAKLKVYKIITIPKIGFKLELR